MNVPKQLDKLVEHACGGGALLGDEAVIVAAEVIVLRARVAELQRQRDDAAGWCDRALGDLREMLDAFDGPGGSQEHALYVVDKARRTLHARDELTAGGAR